MQRGNSYQEIICYLFLLIWFSWNFFLKNYSKGDTQLKTILKKLFFLILYFISFD